MDIVQLEILTRLITVQKGSRYMQLKPKEVGSDKFNYHLQYLVKKGWVTKKQELYCLSQEGRKFISNLDALGNVKQTFKVSVALYVIKENKILLQRRGRHPFYGDVTSVAGKVLPGEFIEDAAGRKLKEETGLEADFKLVGIHRKIRRDDSGQVLEDTFYHVCVASNPKGSLEEKNVFGKNFWATFDEAIEYAKMNVDFGVKDLDVLSLVKGKKQEWFYLQDDTVIKDY